MIADRDTPVPLVQDYRHPVAAQPYGFDAGKWQRLGTALGRNAQQVLAAGTSQVNALAREGVPRRAMTVAPFGVDIDTFDPHRPTPPRSNRPRLVYVDGFAYGNGADDAIRALPHIPHAELLILAAPGEDPDTDPAARQLRQLAADLDIADRVKLVSERGTDTLVAYLCSADLAVSITSYPADATRCVEAMACGTPIVATTAEGREDIVADQVTGSLVASGDPAILGKTVRDLLADKLRLSAYGIAARDRVVSCYSFNRVAAAAEGAYTAATHSGRFTVTSIRGTYGRPRRAMVRQSSH